MVRRPTKRQQYSGIADIITGKVPAKPIRVKPAVKTSQKEADVLSDCLAYLRIQSAYYPLKFDRLNNGAGNLGSGFRQYGIKGAGDIIGTLDGKHIEIECKSGKGGQLSIDQQARRTSIERAGGTYLIVSSRAELETLFKPLLTASKKLPGIALFKTLDDGTIWLEGEEE